RRAVIVPSMFLQASAPALLAIMGILVTRTSTAPVVPVLFLAGLLSGGAHGFLYPGLAALVTDLARPARRATAVGVFSAMFLVGQAAGAFLFGWVAHTLGYASMWTILAFSLLAGAALSMGLARPAGAIFYHVKLFNLTSKFGANTGELLQEILRIAMGEGKAVLFLDETEALSLEHLLPPPQAREASARLVATLCERLDGVPE